jgi:N4-gp56 family major capsid protein
MPTTKSTDMIIPEVMGAMIEAKITAKAKLIPYAKVDNSLVGKAGNTVTVPAWNYIGDAQTVAENGEISFNKLTATSTTFTISKAAVGTQITSEAINSGYGDPVGTAESQFAKSIVSKVDNDLLDAAYTATNVYAGSSLAAISYDGIVDANAQFEDEENGIEKVLFINPAQEATILKDDDFLSADKFTAGVAVNGAVGKIAGCWIKKSKKVKLIQYEAASDGSITIIAEDGTESSTAKKLSTVQPNCATVLAVGDKVNAVASASQYYLCPIIKLQPDDAETEYTENELPALTIFLKKDTEVHSAYKEEYDRYNLTAIKYYGVALTNGAKVVLAKFKK